MTTSVQRRHGVQNQRSLSPKHSAVSPTHQYDPYAPQLGYLSENIHRLLTERECAIFDRGLADYHRRRNIRAFVECLSLVLNTNQKRQLLLPIRDTYVKPSDLVKFNQLVQAHGLATSLKRKKKEEEKVKASSGVHRVEVKRDSNSEWGFSIRGGSEHGIGVFASWVEPGSGAQKSGLQVGDQILKANDLSFENISSYDAVSLMKGTKKLRLWVLSRGRVPTSRMTHKVYRWVSPDGRSASPPPDPFEVQDQTAISEHTIVNEADERKVTVMVDSGQELGISIRGGAEHGLGVYISEVEEGSVAENYGLKLGDQVLEVNGISFQNIIHSDAANALRAQPCMVMKLKDVGKLPHSRITTYGQTQWYQSPQGTMNRNPNTSQEPVFKSGVGTQVMHGKQQPGSIQGSGLMNEVARSVLNSQELATFNYYVNQYDQYGLSVEDLVVPLLDLLNTPEKLKILSEVRTLIKARDLQRFNELTVHKEIAAKKAANKHQTGSLDGSLTAMSSHSTNSRTGTPSGYGQHDDSDDFILSPLPVSAHGDTMTSQDDEESGRDKVPQKLNKGMGTFHAPPPPSTSHPTTSTPDSHASPDPQSVLADTLKERRQWTRPGAKEHSMDDETWDGQWNETSLMSSIHAPPARRGFDDVDSSADISAIEARVRSETEAQLRREFEQQQKKNKEEQERLLAQEQQEKEMTLRREREQLERQMKEKERRMKEDLEQQIRLEAEQKMKRELEEKERALTAEHAMRAQENEERLKQLEQEDLEDQIRQIEERTRLELEEKIWKEAEEHMRQEFEAKIEQEKDKLQSQVSKAKSNERTSSTQEMEKRLRRELENKYKREYEEKIEREKAQRRKIEQEEHQRKQEEERAKREDEVARLEAEEQARIEMEERIRKEAEATARAEYGTRLQRETEERARLADEVKARKAAEERMEREQRERVAEEKREREQRKRAPATKPKPQKPQQYVEPEAEEEEESDQEETQEEPTSPEDQRMLEVQRRRRQAEEREQQQREEEERRVADQARTKQEQERSKKLDLQRKREENIRRREEERKQKEAEAKQKLEQKSDSLQRQRQPASRSQDGTNAHSKKRQTDSKEEVGVQKVKVNFGDQEKHTKKEPSRQQVIEEERRKAEEKLQRRLRRAQEKKQANSAEGVMETDGAQAPTPSSPAEQGPGRSYGGYENLEGNILHITVTKVCKKLGVAIDGGANTKQKAVIIREISPEGCAAQTGIGLSVGQQILSFGGESLFKKKHKDVVLTIKSSFEGPLNKTLELVVLDPQ